MADNFTAINNIIIKAAAEAGIGEREDFRIHIIGIDSGLIEFILETEWVNVTCYAELESTRILGIMTESVTASYPKAA